MSSVTKDTLFDGDIVCNQYRNGYRFSVDAVLAAHFQVPGRNYKILDLGCGCGVIGLVCLYRWGQLGIHVTGLELQKDLCEITSQNIKANKFDQNYRLVQGDIREPFAFLPVESFDQIICNPPFFKEGSGRASENAMAHKARHQVAGDLDAFLLGTAKLLKNRKNCVFIYPAPDLVEFVATARKYRLETKRIQLIYNYPEGDNEARLALFQCQKNGKTGVKIERPFYIYQKKNGPFHPAMEKLYRPDIHKDSGV